MDRSGKHMDETAFDPSRFDVRLDVPPQALSSDLYHIVFSAQEGTELRLDRRMFFLLDRQVAAISAGENAKLRAPAWAVVSFSHDFFCVRVSRSEVFCDGVVFNRVTAGPVITMPAADWEATIERAREMVRVAASPSVLRDERLVGSLRSLLLACADARLMALDLPVATAGPSEEILSFQDAIEARFLDHPDPEDIADACGVPLERLSRLVRAQLGMTIRQSVSERLAIEARYRLRNGRASVKEVAYDLGFSDPLYFSRFFKKHYGSSPTAYFELASGEEGAERTPKVAGN